MDTLADLDVAGFGQDGAADRMAPGTVLLSLAEAAAGDVQHLTDDQVLGLARAGRRLAARAAWVQAAAVAEFAARNPAAPADERHGEFAGFAAHLLAPELVLNDTAAEAVMHQAQAAARRLPRCLAALRAGRISEFQLKIAADATGALDDDGAAEADLLIAAAAPSLTPGMFGACCRRTVMMINPAAAKRRREAAAKDARVEVFQEHSGTAALCGRDLPTDAVLAASTHIDALARRLRAAG